MYATQVYEEAWPTVAGTAQIIVEMDGSMVPIVEPDAGQPDRRKGKHLRWKGVPRRRQRHGWVSRERLKQGQPKVVLEALQPYLEKPDIADDEAPVRTCSRYLGGRLKQLHYDEALQHCCPSVRGRLKAPIDR